MVSWVIPSILLLIGKVAAAHAATGDVMAAKSCPPIDARERGSRYHDDNLCDRASYERFKTSLQRHGRIQAFRSTPGSAARIPNQRTVLCPPHVAPLAPSLPDPRTGEMAHFTGLDTVWIVENQSSKPVVVAYLNAQGVEVSARNSQIAPPQADPEAILAPGSWMAVNTFEGHEFRVIELDADGRPGRVLLQHVVGLIPVGSPVQAAQYACPGEPDVEPKINVTQPHPEFTRVPPQVLRPCNTLDIGFRNMLGCPMNVYYVTPPTGPDSCEETFRFHLGVDATTPDFFEGWTSPTKFEGTFMGHSFAFRLSSDPSVLIDTVTLAPTLVHDCPDLSQQTVQVTIPHSTGIMVPLERHLGLDATLNITTAALKMAEPWGSLKATARQHRSHSPTASKLYNETARRTMPASVWSF